MKTYMNDSFRGMKINCDDSGRRNCREDILEAVHNRLEDMNNRHSKTLFIRFDLRYPQGHYSSDSNEDTSTFTNSFTTHLKRKGLDPQYVWVREQSREKHQHYHFMLLLNGNLTQNPYGHLRKAEEFWGKAIGSDQPGLVNFCDKSRSGEPQENSVMIRRTDPNAQEKLSECMYRGSYLAKTNTKGYAPYRHREWGASRLRKKKE